MADDPQLLELPEETLNLILSYSAPRNERVWAWIGNLRRTCKTFNRLALAKSLAPTSFCLDSYADYYMPRLRSVYSYIDVRKSILQSMNEHSWMRENLKELHINWSSILRRSDDRKLKGDSQRRDLYQV